MVDDCTENTGAVRAGSCRDDRDGDAEKGGADAAPAGNVATPISCPANDSNPDDGAAKLGEVAVSNGGVVTAAERAVDNAPHANDGGDDTISCTISDGNGGTVTVPIEETLSSVADMRRITARPTHTARKLGASKQAKMAMSPVGKDGSETLRVQFNGLPSGSVVSHPEAIAKKNAELAMLSDRIAALQTELSAIERTRAERTRDRQDLIDAGGPQAEIDSLTAELTTLNGRITLKAAQRSVVEIERDIARFESQQLTQTAGAGGTASFHGPGSGYVLHLPDGIGNDYGPGL